MGGAPRWLACAGRSRRGVVPSAVRSDNAPRRRSAGFGVAGRCDRSGRGARCDVSTTTAQAPLSGRMSGASGRLRALGGFGAARKAVPEIRVRQSCRPLGRPGSVDSEFSSVWRRLQRSRADLSKTPGGEYEQLTRPGSQRVPPGHSRYRRAGSTRLLGLLPPAASIRLAHRDLQSPRARFLWGSCRRSHVKPVRFQLADSSERCGVRRCRRSGLAPRPLTLTPSFSPA